MTQKILITDPNTHMAETGEVYELHFTLTSLPIINKYQRASIEKRVNADPHLQVLNITQNGNYLILTVKIVDNPFPIALAIGAVAAVLTGFFVWSSVGKVYKVVEDNPSAGFGIGATGLGIAAAGLAALAFFIRR